MPLSKATAKQQHRLWPNSAGAMLCERQVELYWKARGETAHLLPFQNGPIGTVSVRSGIPLNILKQKNYVSTRAALQQNAPWRAITHHHVVTYAPAADGEVGDGVEVGLKHLVVAEHLVTVRVDSIQCDLDVRRRHPVLRMRQARTQQANNIT